MNKELIIETVTSESYYIISKKKQKTLKIESFSLFMDKPKTIEEKPMYEVFYGRCYNNEEQPTHILKIRKGKEIYGCLLQGEIKKQTDLGWVSVPNKIKEEMYSIAKEIHKVSTHQKARRYHKKSNLIAVEDFINNFKFSSTISSKIVQQRVKEAQIITR